MPAPLRTSYIEAATLRLDSSRLLVQSGQYATSIYLSGLAIESVLKAFISVKGEEIKGHNLSRLAVDANLSRRLKTHVRDQVNAAISEAAPLWRNLFRYAGERDLDRMAREWQIKFEVNKRLVKYSDIQTDGLQMWSERLHDLAALIVQEGHLLWQSKKN